MITVKGLMLTSSLIDTAALMKRTMIWLQEQQHILMSVNQQYIKNLGTMIHIPIGIVAAHSSVVPSKITSRQYPIITEITLQFIHNLLKEVISFTSRKHQCGTDYKSPDLS